MATIDNLDIRISVKLKQTNKQLDNLIKKMRTVSSALSRIGGTTSKISVETKKINSHANNTQKTFKGLASAIGKFYAKYFLMIRGIKSLWKSIESTADYIEAFNYFEVSFNKIGKEWAKDFEKFGYDNAEAYAKSFNKRAQESLSKLSGLTINVQANGDGLLTESGTKNLGLNIQEITQYASQLASVTNSIGQTGEVSLRASNAFTKLAGDISSLFNQDYSSVAKNLQSGLIGQSRALYKYGIDITNATLQTYAYNMGIEKNVSEMTQAEKMQLRMIAILDQSKVSWGDLANTINSPSNMIRQFKNNLKEAGLVLGQLFIPLLQKVLPVVNGVTIAIKRLLVNFAGLLGIKLDLDSFGQSGSDMEDFSDSLDEVAESAKKAKAGLRGFDELKTINQGDSSNDGISDTIDLTNEIIKSTEEYEDVWNKAYEQMENKAEKYAKKVEKIFASIQKTLSKVSLPNLDFTNLNASLANLWGVISNFGGNDIGDNLNYLMENFFNPLAEWTINEAVPSALDFIAATLSLLSSLTPALDRLWKTFFKPIAEFVGDTIIFTLDAVALGLTAISDWINNHQGIIVSATDIVRNFFIAWAAYTVVTKAKGVIVDAVLTIGIKLLYLKDTIVSLLTPTNLWIAAIAILATGIYELVKNWNKMSALEKAINIFNGIAAGAAAAAIAIGLFHTSWSVGLAAAAIAAGIALIASTKATVQNITNSGTYQPTPRVPRFDTGGYPESASLFFANENGVPELVGTIGGKTAVASGGEITGIKDAILQSSNRDAQLMERNNQLLSALLEKEYGITDSDIGRSAQRYARDYYNRTGNEAYSF